MCQAWVLYFTLSKLTITLPCTSSYYPPFAGGEHDFLLRSSRSRESETYCDPRTHLPRTNPSYYVLKPFDGCAHIFSNLIIMQTIMWEKTILLLIFDLGRTKNKRGLWSSSFQVPWNERCKTRTQIHQQREVTDMIWLWGECATLSLAVLWATHFRRLIWLASPSFSFSSLQN